MQLNDEHRKYCMPRKKITEHAINLSDHHLLLMLITRRAACFYLQYNTKEQHTATSLLVLHSGQKSHKEKGTASLPAS